MARKIKPSKTNFYGGTQSKKGVIIDREGKKPIYDDGKRIYASGVAGSTVYLNHGGKCIMVDTGPSGKSKLSCYKTHQEAKRNFKNYV